MEKPAPWRRTPKEKLVEEAPEEKQGPASKRRPKEPKPSKEVSIDSTKRDDSHQTNPVSPVAALAKGVGTDSRKLQLMKASLYNDEDMADGKSVVSENLDGHSTPGQLVPNEPCLKKYSSYTSIHSLSLDAQDSLNVMSAIS